MPDSSIVLMGGADYYAVHNDVWRSTDNGATWTQLTAHAGWLKRVLSNSVVIPDGSIVLIGGNDGSSLYHDVWNFVPTGSSEQNPSHIYSTPGTYQVALQAYNTGGFNSTRKTGYIIVSDVAPVANFTANQTSGDKPLTVQFNDTSTGGTPTSWNWSFGNDTWFNTTDPLERNVSYTYSASGTFTAQLTVSNPAGENTTVPGTTIIVTDPIVAPVASFTANKTSGDKPLMVQFNDTSTGGTPTSWNWSFGNDTWFNTTDPLERNASYTYSASGTFTTQLTVSNPAGENTTVPGTTIIVTDPIVAPVSSFTANQTSGDKPLTVQFNDTSTGGTPTSPGTGVLGMIPGLTRRIH